MTKAARKLMPKKMQHAIEADASQPSTSGKRNANDTESDDAFQPPAKLKPSENTIFRMVDFEPEQLEKPVNEGPFKVQRVSAQNFEPKNEKSRKKLESKRGRCTLNLLKKCNKDLQIFTTAILETIKLRKDVLSKKIYSMEKKQIAKEINEKMDSIVKNCVTATFDRYGSILLCHTGDFSTTQFTIDTASMDSGSRWCFWHNSFVLSCVKKVKNKLVANKIKEISALINLARRRIRRIRVPDLKKKALQQANQIEDILNNLRSKALAFKNYGQVPEHKTFKLKVIAIKERAKRWVAVKRRFREMELEDKIMEWKKAATDFNEMVRPKDRERQWKKLSELCDSLSESIETHDALIDICMYASRLQVLYHHAHNVFQGELDLEETQNVLQSLEDTERLLILAETKLLLDAETQSRKTLLIDAYLQGDAFNLEKGRLKRFMESNAHPLVRRKCIVKLKMKEKIFITSCKDLTLGKIVSEFPKSNWEKVIKKEEETETPGRINFFEEPDDFDYALEIPPVLLSRNAASRTLRQMVVDSPQITNIVDEHFKSVADAEKREPKMYIQSFIPLLRMRSEDPQVENSRKRHHDDRDMQRLENQKAYELENQELLETYRYQLAAFGTVPSEDGENFVKFDRAVHHESQLDERIQATMKEFRRRKIQQELKRRQLMESSFRNVSLTEGNVLGRRMEELSRNDLANISYRSQFITKKTENTISKEAAMDTSGSEPEEDMGEVFNSMMLLTEQMGNKSHGEEEKQKIQQKLDIQTKKFVEMHKRKTANMMTHMSRMHNNRPKAVPTPDSSFEDMLNSLEFYEGHRLDRMDAVDFESSKFEEKRLRTNNQPHQSFSSTKYCKKSKNTQ